MRSYSKWVKFREHLTEEGIRIQYREYPNAYSVWAVKGVEGKKLEGGGLRKGHSIEDCFERAFKTLEAKNLFIDLPEKAA